MIKIFNTVFQEYYTFSEKKGGGKTKKNPLFFTPPYKSTPNKIDFSLFYLLLRHGQ